MPIVITHPFFLLYQRTLLRGHRGPRGKKAFLRPRIIMGYSTGRLRPLDIRRHFWDLTPLVALSAGKDPDDLSFLGHLNTRRTGRELDRLIP